MDKYFRIFLYRGLSVSLFVIYRRRPYLINLQSFVFPVTFLVTVLIWFLKFLILSRSFVLLSDFNLSRFGFRVSLVQLETIKRQVPFVYVVAN